MEYDKNAGEGRISFTVPAGAGAYAPEELFLKILDMASPGGLYHRVRQLRILVENLIATAVVEVWILRQGGDPTNNAHWFNSGTNVVAAGLAALIELAGVRGVKLRCKSGGTAGAQAVSAWWS